MHDSNVSQHGRLAPVDRVARVFASRLREIRQGQGLSQARFAKQLERQGLKLDPSAITRIEKNATEPTAGRAVLLGEAALIAKALGVRLDEMLRVTSTMEEQLAKARVEADQASYEVAKAQHVLERAEAAAAATHDRVRMIEAQLVRQVELAKLIEVISHQDVVGFRTTEEDVGPLVRVRFRDHHEESFAVSDASPDRADAELSSAWMSRTFPPETDVAADRAAAAEIVLMYENGDSIRSIAEWTGLAYGVVQRSLTDSGVRLRTRAAKKG